MLKIIILLLFFALPSSIKAQENEWIITNFNSDITINQDTSLTVEETIEVEFKEQRHGIFRTIPVIYRNNGKIINSRLQVISVSDKYKTSRQGDSIEIKIGDPDKYVSGNKTYKIVYRVSRILQRYDTSDELYWNITGANWETSILNARATVKSPFSSIIRIDCFSGHVGSSTRCTNQNIEDDTATFGSTKITPGSDMTITLGLDQNSQLNFTPSFGELLRDYWGYFAALIPCLSMLVIWIKRGRDFKFIDENIYNKEDRKQTKVSIFGKREFLPTVYSPISGLTPAEVGTLVDEKVDIHDVVAEILELGRLGYLKIEKLDKKLAKDDYLITKLKNDTSKLRTYQQFLFDSLFSFGEAEDNVKLSELKNKFYAKLRNFREKLYKHITDNKYFTYRPDHTRAFWIVAVFVLTSAIFALVVGFSEYVGNYWSLAVLIVSSLLALLIAFHMPRKTAVGYSLFRQIKGLSHYLKKGKWREEVKEKHLFLDEILPLAISLGVVSKLAKDMRDLGVEPPSYMNVGTTNWAAAISGFNNSAASSFTAGSSSSGSWSGGSGFSGGSSGGGFGGGGGGSW